MPSIKSQSIAMVGTGMILQLAFTFVLCLCLSSVYGQDEVYTLRARINGTIMTTRKGRNISAYLGIPYAEPPIGHLRFNNPRPWSQFDQFITADTDGNECPQFNDDGKLVGNEDCLYLNVYTPNLYTGGFGYSPAYFTSVPANMLLTSLRFPPKEFSTVRRTILNRDFHRSLYSLPLGSMPKHWIHDPRTIPLDQPLLMIRGCEIDIRPEELYPVMVYFHGGNFFTQGSGSSKNAGPEYLLDKDIVLVTVNYRLGVLGFLSTGDNWVPGNFGLKDQVVALQWVRQNIVSFGGHPFRVTIFGQDAGGASTSLHAIFGPDLFEQYISQSGNALAFWSFQDIKEYKKRAFDLGRYLNCPTDRSRYLVHCLRKADAYDLVDTNSIFNDTPWVLHTWGPTLEENIKGGYITNIPLHEMTINGIKNCPAILGNVFDEGLLWSAAFYANDTLYNSIKKNLLDFLKFVITIFFGEGDRISLPKKTQYFYFNGSQTTDKKSFTQSMANFLTDAAFRCPFELQTRTTAEVDELNPPYIYAFDYRGTYSKTSVTLGNNDDIGVTHGDDLIYLFPIKTTNITLNDSDEKMIDIMVDFWTSFAYTGTPTSQYTSDPNVWKPFNEGAPNLLKIGNNSDPTEIAVYPLYDSRMLFWAKALTEQINEFLSF